MKDVRFTSISFGSITKYMVLIIGFLGRSDLGSLNSLLRSKTRTSESQLIPGAPGRVLNLLLEHTWSIPELSK